MQKQRFTSPAAVYLQLVIVLVLSSRMASSVANGLVRTRACFGAGCFWGTEKFFSDFGKKVFPDSGIILAGKVGYQGPKYAKPDPSYEAVCTGATGHVEVYNFEFEGNADTYRNLVKHFFMFHDPTTANRQGNDMGTQYASAIFCYGEEQCEIARSVKNELQGLLDMKAFAPYVEDKVTTQIINAESASEFYDAESYHQKYLEENPGGYCNHFYRFQSWPTI